MIMVANNHNMISLVSKVTQKLLNYFFINKHKEHYVNELARILEVDVKNLDKKLKELEKNGIFKSRFKGNQRHYSINTSFPLYKEYEKIVQKTIGVETSLKETFKKINGIEEAYIFGSYANNKLDASSDIDIMIIGNHKALDAQKAVLKTQKLLNREINIIDMDRNEFDSKKEKKDNFIREVFNNKTIKIA